METEAKYTVPDIETFGRLEDAQAFGNYVKKGTHEKRYHDRYVDTPDHSFYNRRFFARLREQQEGGAPLITLKRLGVPPEDAVHTREEYQTQVSGLDIASWPEGEPKTLAEELAGGQVLVDFITVDQVRTVSTLYDAEREVAELSLDKITMQTPGEPVYAYELEVELMPDGTLSDLKTIGALLTEKYGLTPQPLSKFERAIMLSSGPRKESNGASQPPAESPDEDSEQKEETQPDIPAGSKRTMGVVPLDSMQTAGRKILGSYYRDMVDNESGSIEGEDPEALHDMRVATRRMRAAFRVLDPYLQTSSAGKARRGLRSVTEALGGVRDLDVLLDNARTFSSQLPEDQQQDMQGLIQEWDGKRNVARKELIRLLKSKDYVRFKKRMEAFLKEEESRPAESAAVVEPMQVRHVAASAIWERYEAVRAFETIMDAPTLEQLHDLRIKAKYLRYTLECFRETLPPESTGMIRDIVNMQDQLGELHDAAVAAELIRSYQERMASKAKNNGNLEPKTGLLKYLADRENAIRRLYAEFFNTWAQVDSRKWRKKLATTVAEL